MTMSLTDRSAGDGPAGAVDNGSGTVGVMALAKIFSQFSFARTIEYIAFGAEEQGLHGSAHYVAQAQAAGEDIVCALTMDMIGYSNRYFGTAPSVHFPPVLPSDGLFRQGQVCPAMPPS